MKNTTFETLTTAKNGFTHAGVFHADDVFSTALLKIINPSIIIERGFVVEENYDGIAYDIGLGEFDHHQANGAVRENGIKYAAFGLLWKVIGPKLVGEDFASRFDSVFVSVIDNSDNTGIVNPMSVAISTFNPNWNSSKKEEDCFWEAVSVATKILTNEIANCKSTIEGKEVIDGALTESKCGIVILPEFIPWQSYVIPTESKFVIFPSKRGGYNAQGVPVTYGNNEVRVKFPWGGMSEYEIKEKTGLQDITFCHNSGFLIAAKTKEAAIAACIYALS